MDVRQFEQVRSAVAEQRATLEVNRLAARRLVTRKEGAAQYIQPTSRWLFRLLAGIYAATLTSGVVLLITGRFLYAALAFLAGIVLQHLWGGLAVELLRMIALRDANFLGLALREGWMTLIEPPVAPGRPVRLVELNPVAARVEQTGYSEDIEAARAVLADRPDDAQTRFHLGVTYILAGQFDKALEESRILTMIDASLAAKLQQLTRLLSS
jgi:hypothetical protein